MVGVQTLTITTERGGLAAATPPDYIGSCISSPYVLLTECVEPALYHSAQDPPSIKMRAGSFGWAGRGCSDAAPHTSDCFAG